MNEDDLLEGETPEERERRLKATRERLGTKGKKSPVGIKASYFLKHFQGKLPGRKVTVGDMNKESREESCKGKKGMKTFKEYFEENLAAESEQLDEESCKVGDQVHVGHMVKGGAGVEGTVEKIDGNQVWVKNSEGRTFKGLLKNVSKKD